MTDKHGKAEMMLVLFVPDGKSPDWVHAEMLKSGFSMDRNIIPAYAADENGMPSDGAYFMQKIKSGEH